jgi:hypothetical protein
MLHSWRFVPCRREPTLMATHARRRQDSASPTRMWCIGRLAINDAAKSRQAVNCKKKVIFNTVDHPYSSSIGEAPPAPRRAIALSGASASARALHREGGGDDEARARVGRRRLGRHARRWAHDRCCRGCRRCRELERSAYRTLAARRCAEIAVGRGFTVAVDAPLATRLLRGRALQHRAR